MAVTWNWKDKIGKATFEGADGKNYNVNLYTGNVLCVMCHEWKEDCDKKVYNVQGFFHDETHLKRCLGLVKGYSNCYGNLKQAKLNVAWPVSFTIAKHLALAGVKVELFLKERGKRK